MTQERELVYREGRRRPSLPCRMCGGAAEYEFASFTVKVGVWDVFINAELPESETVKCRSAYVCDPCLKRARDVIVRLLNGACADNVILSARVLEGNRDPNERGYMPGDIIR